MRGDWEFTQTGTLPVAEGVLNGGDAVVLLRNAAPHIGIFVMTRPEFTSLTQLAGKRVGVLTDATSGQTGVVTRLAVENAAPRRAIQVWARIKRYTRPWLPEK